MTGALLRVPRVTPESKSQWFSLEPVPAGSWPSVNINSVYYNGHTYFGFIDFDGSIRVGQYNHTTHAVVTSPAIVTGLVADDHSAPGVLIRQSDHKVVVAVAPHATNHMYVAVSTNAEDVSAWGSATDIETTLAGGGLYSYATLFQLSGESGKIYLIYRDGSPTATAVWSYSTSTDGGSTWSAGTEFFSAGTGKGVYMSLDTDSVSRIDFVATDGNVFNDGTAISLYHFYYTGGSFFKSDGTSAGSLPLGPSNVTKIHDGTTSGALGATMQVSKKGSNVYVAYSAAVNSSFSTNPFNYFYGVWNGSSWTTHLVTDTGVNGTDRGICLSRDAPDTIIFLGRVVSSSSRMFRYLTTNGGTSWAVDDLTGTEADSNQLNSGPISPLNAVSTLETLWIYGNFGPSFFLTVAIRGYPNWQNL